MTFLEQLTSAFATTDVAQVQAELKPLTVKTDKCGVLTTGDTFRIGSDYYKITALNRGHVEVWGGSQDPGGYRAFHAFYYEDVQKKARPLHKGRPWRSVPWQILART